MKLQEIFNHLTYGELSQLSFGGADIGEISEKNHARVLTHVNLALTELHKRFLLKEETVRIALLPGQYRYELHPDYSIRSAKFPNEPKFILDTASWPFIGNVLKIEQVKTQNGVLLPLRDTRDIYSCFTPSATTLTVPALLVDYGLNLPEMYKTNTLDITFRANHRKLTIPIGLFDPDRIEVELPDTHLEALLYYMASRINNPIGMTNEFHTGNSYAKKFEDACALLKLEGLTNDQAALSRSVRDTGWV